VGRAVGEGPRAGVSPYGASGGFPGGAMRSGSVKRGWMDREARKEARVAWSSSATKAARASRR